MDFINWIVPYIEQLGALNYWLVFLAGLLEALVIIGMVFPGSVYVLLVGFLVTRTSLNLGELILFAAAGSIIGDAISYWLGTKGVRLFKNENKLLKLSHLQRGERYFKKHGNVSVFLGRFAGPLRPVIPFVAGLSRMPLLTFNLWNVLGGFLWAAFYLVLGYFFGGTVNTIETWSGRIGFYIFIVLVAIFLAGYLLKKSRPVLRFIGSLGRSLAISLKTNPEIQKLTNRFPRTWTFIKARFTRRQFQGLPLTVLTLAALYVFFSFMDLLGNVQVAGPLVAADTRLSNLFFMLRDREVIHFFLWITLLGKWQLIVGLALIVSLLLWLWHKRTFVLPLWLTLIGAAGTSAITKIILARPRPDVAYYLERDYSFPSGHATLAVALYGFLVYLLWRLIKRWSYRINLLIAGLLIVLAVGFSRLYLDVHFLSDVWGGYLVGLFFLIIGIGITEWLIRRRPAKSEKYLSLKMLKKTRLRTKIITILLLLSYPGLYLGFGVNYNPAARQIKPPQYLTTSDLLTNFSASRQGLPRFTETLLGRKQEPLSFIVEAASDKQLIKTFQEAGWQLADKTRPSSVLSLARAALNNQPYQKAPMSPSFWNALPHDFGFEKSTDTQSVKQRHHARFWRTELVTPTGHHIYVGTASLDTGLKWLVTHKISPDLDSEREIIFTDLQNHGLLDSYLKRPLVKPTLGTNFGGDEFFTDGQAYLLILK